MATVSNRVRGVEGVEGVEGVAGQVASAAQASQANSPAPTSPAINLLTSGIGDRAQRSAFMWRTLAKSVEQEFCREDLQAGYSGTAKLTISGEIDGQPIRPIKIEAVGTVAHDGEQAASATPEPDKLIAFLLGQMNAVTGAASIRKAIEVYAATGHYPEAAPATVEASGNMLKTLRSLKRSPRKGNVSIKSKVFFAE